MRKKLEKQCLLQNTKLLTGLQEEMKTTMKQLNIQKQTLNKQMTSMMSNAEVVFYEGKLSAASLVADHKLSDLSHVSRCELTDTVLMMIDTAGKRMEESKSASRVAPSFANLGEAAVVVQHVKSLV